MVLNKDFVCFIAVLGVDPLFSDKLQKELRFIIK